MQETTPAAAAAEVQQPLLAPLLLPLMLCITCHGYSQALLVGLDGSEIVF